MTKIASNWMIGVGAGLFLLLLVGAPFYDWLRTVPQVSAGWCGRYRSLAAWERETERGHLDLWVAPDVVTIQWTFEGERLTPTWLKVQRALNQGDEVKTWPSYHDEKPTFILREELPGVFKAFANSKHEYPEVEWVPVERAR